MWGLVTCGRLRWFGHLAGALELMKMMIVGLQEYMWRWLVGFGITGSVLAWIQSFLTDRHQIFQVGPDRSPMVVVPGP